jgi:hypothetical protein
MATTLRPQVETDPSARGEISRTVEASAGATLDRPVAALTRRQHKGRCVEATRRPGHLAPAQVTTVMKTVTRAPKASEVIRAIADRIRVVRELEPRWWILLTAPSVY